MESRPHTSGLTRWSREDLARVPGNTDHWTKLRLRANELRDSELEDSINSTPQQERGQGKLMNSRGHNQLGKQTAPVIHLPLVSYNDAPGRNNDVHEASIVPAPKSGIKKSWLDNSYQKRAREGFRYWTINRPHPTKFGKYGIGSYKMVLGMGLAPRT